MVEASRAASKEMAKDAAQMKRQAAALRARAARAQTEAQEARLQAQQIRSALPAALLLTIPEAARRLHVAERTLRTLLTAPEHQARLIEQTRKIGIYYKFVPLLSPDLIGDLISHFAAKKSPRS